MQSSDKPLLFCFPVFLSCIISLFFLNKDILRLIRSKDPTKRLPINSFYVLPDQKLFAKSLLVDLQSLLTHCYLLLVAESAIPALDLNYSHA